MSPAGSPDESTDNRADAASDRDLLTRFVRRQDERAFAEIVGRYGELVMGVCRRVLFDSHSAEDAFQATFLVLARSARRIRKRRSLAAWLHGVALRVSNRALVNQRRRREKQCETPEVTVDPLADITALYEQQMLDEQLQHLPEKYREPLVLHYFQGQSQQEVADQLGLSVTAVEGRLRRGRHELRRRLVRTGVGLGAALAAAQFASSTASAGQASLQPLIAVTAKAAVAHAASQAVTALVSQEAASLAGKELAMIAASKLATTVGLTSAAVALVLVGIGAAGAGNSPTAGGQRTAVFVDEGDVLGPAGGSDSMRLAQGPNAANRGVEQPPPPDEREIRQLRQQIIQLEKALNEVGQFTPADLKPRDGRTAMIESRLNSITNMEFPANPLKDVVDYLSEIHNVPILLDEPTLADAGVGPDQEISLVISGISLRNALELLLENVGGVPLDYVVEHQVLNITTREKADQVLDTRVYSLRALENSGFDSYSVANVIRKTIEPGSWAHIEIVPEPGAAGMEGMMGSGMAAGGGEMAMGGIGSAMMGPGGLGEMKIDKQKSTGPGTIEPLPGCLVITQSQRVHRAVADLLEQLRAQAAEQSGGPDAGQAQIKRTLDSSVIVDYVGGTVLGALRKLEERYGVRLIIDESALRKAGIDLDSPYSLVTGGVTLRTSLNQVLQQVSGGRLTFHVEEEGIRIALKADVAALGPPDRPNLDADLEGQSSSTIHGTIRVQGELAPRPPLVPDVGKTPDTKHLTDPIPDESVIVGADGGLANCIVFLDKVPAGLSPPPAPEQPVLFQSQGLQFAPHAMVVRTGQRIQIANKDPVAIDVRDSPSSNAPVNMLLRAKNSFERKYDGSEKLPVAIKDDIHPWMSAFILPLDHPWAAVTDEQGRFEIPQLPPGEYTFKVWHEKAGYIDRQLKVTVTPEGTSKLQLTVDHSKLENQ